MDIVPSAIKKIAENITDGILVIDSQNKILFFNNSIQQIFETHIKFSRNMSIQDLNYGVIRFSIPNEDIQKITILLSNPSLESHKLEFNLQNKTYLLKTQTIKNPNQEYLGKIVTFTDITDFKETQMKLEQYAVLSRELAIEKERTRFAREIHDTVGHSMTLLMSLLEVIKIKLNKHEDVQSQLEQALEATQKGFSEVRKSIKGLKDENFENLLLSKRIQILVDDFNVSNVDIEFNVMGMETNTSNEISHALYRSAQEAITNAVRHGNANHIAILLYFEEKKIRLVILDNGKGNSNIIKGFGLKSMEDRIRCVDGKILFDSDEESGFIIRIEIPVERNVSND
jgi:signal transduction histidine kinase